MPLKIVCIEEHTNDTGLMDIARPALARQAPYVADYGTGYQDQPDPNGPAQCEAPDRAEAIQGAPVKDRLLEMDAHGIDVQVLSYPHYSQYAPAAAAVDATRAANDRMAQAVARRPDRFAGFSVPPWQDTDAAVREAERSATQLGLTGTMLAGLPGENTFLDDRRFAPVLAKLEELQVALYLHPGPPMLPVQQVYFRGFSKEVIARLSLFSWGFHHEAGLQVAWLILSGALDRHPGLSIVSGHWGEMVPFYLQRLDDTLPPAAMRLSRGVIQTYRDQVHVTPSEMLNLPHFRFVQEVLGAERIIFSMDYPWITLTGARAWLEALPISEADRNAIAHVNAERLLRLRSEPRTENDHAER